jgi:TonB family protein
MKSLFTLLFFVCAAQAVFAQRQNVYFLKNNGKYVEVRDSADYIRIVREPDSASTLYNVFEFYPNGTRKLIGKSSKINPPQFEGQCITYYVSGKRQSTISYKSGKMAGEDVEYFPNGRVYAEFSYPQDNRSPYLDQAGYLIKTNNDSLGNAQVTDGNGYYKGYNSKFTYVEEEGPVKNGRRDGQWNGNYQTNNTTFTETYSNGDLISGSANTKDGKVNTYTKSRWVLPQFKGGVEAFGRFLSRHINYAEEARRKNIEGTVILTFIVEKDGSLSDIIVARSVAAILDDEAVRVLKESPKWIPGTQFGLPARVQYTVPVSFAMSR